MTCPFFFVIIFHVKTSVRGTRTTRWERGIIMIQCAGVCTTQEFVTLNLSITYAECHSPHMFCFHVEHGSHLSSNVPRETYIICCANYNNG